MRFSQFRQGDKQSAQPAQERGWGAVSLTSTPGALPAVLEAPHPQTDLVSWLLAHSTEVRALLHSVGAVLFRNFAAPGPVGMERCVYGFSGEPMNYRENTSPRSAIYGRIRTSTDYTATEPIVMHNEQSYSSTFPLKLFLCCETAAQEGGETPLADCRCILQKLSPDVRQKFREHGWLYVTNFIPGLGPSWQEVFQMNDREELEAFLTQGGIDYRWSEAGNLQTRTLRPAEAVHPSTGEQVWFNHILFWHRTSLNHEIQQLLDRDFTMDELPHNTYYGDGSPLEQETVQELRRLYAEESRTFSWKKGDLLIADNMLVAHGRAPYAGPRRILFAMAEPIQRTSLPMLNSMNSASV